MSYKLVYSPEALIEFKDTVSWYTVRSNRAAENFVTAIKEKIASICKNPHIFRNPYKHFRQTSLKKYPFYLIYFIDEKEKTVILTSIYHHKRNPRKRYNK
ncbi:MAG: type II toxin-antitoxin system RelE/ParE family toxin [Ferruginibacter sp.]|nr:type II toxin-antitoxin system RelE/ParE family toxin [Ferruginibacter sp.]